MYEAVRIYSTIQKMIPFENGILGISHVCWSLSGKKKIDYHIVYYLANEDANYLNEVSIIITQNIEASVTTTLSAFPINYYY